MAGQDASIAALLKRARQTGATILYISPGAGGIRWKRNQRVEPVPGASVDAQELEDLIRGRFLTNNIAKQTLARNGSATVFDADEDGPLRFTAFATGQGTRLTIRFGGKAAPAIDSFGLPKSVLDLVRRRHGLIVLTGPRSAGTAAVAHSVADVIGEDRMVAVLSHRHEYDHDNFAQISVIEIGHGRHASTVADAIEGLYDAEVDAYVVEHVTDSADYDALLRASQGHLVVLVTDGRNTAQALQAIASRVAPELGRQRLNELAVSLIGAVALRRIPGQQTGKPLTFAEVLITNEAVREAIRKERFEEISRTILPQGLEQGMRSLESELNRAARERLISVSDARAEAVFPEQIAG